MYHRVGLCSRHLELEDGSRLVVIASESSLMAFKAMIFWVPQGCGWMDLASHLAGVTYRESPLIRFWSLLCGDGFSDSLSSQEATLQGLAPGLAFPRTESFACTCPCIPPVLFLPRPLGHCADGLCGQAASLGDQCSPQHRHPALWER